MKERSSHAFEVTGGKNNWYKSISSAIGCSILMVSLMGCSSNPSSSTPITSSTTSTEMTADAEGNPEISNFNDYLKNASKNFDDVESLKKEISIPLFAPTQLPEGYKPTTIKKLQDHAFLINYELPQKDILFLAQDGGEYNFTDPTKSYDFEEVKKINGYEVSLLGTNEHISEHKYHLITWKINEITYSMQCASALSLTQVETILNSLKEVK